MTNTATTTIAQLQDGDRFSVDGGGTWHVFAIHGFGTVSVYATHRRDSNAPCVRINADEDDQCLVQRARGDRH